MSERPIPPGDFDLDADVRDAWVSFRDQFAAHLGQMGPGDTLRFDVLVAADDETGPYAQFAVDRYDVLRCELSSNEYLGPGHRLDAAQQRALVDDGWRPPGVGLHDRNFHLDVDEVDAERLADMTTTALRDVFGVIHPSFLDLAVWDADADVIDEDPFDDEEDDVHDDEASNRDDELAALWDEVETALTEAIGDRVDRDDDGDIRIDLPNRSVFVRIHDAYMAEVYTTVAVDISGRTRAAEVLGDLNHKHRFVKWLLVGDCVVATVQIPFKPFVVEHVLGMVAVLDSLDRLADSLAESLGGRLPPGGAD